MISYAVFYDIYEDQDYNEAENNPQYIEFEILNKYWTFTSLLPRLAESGYCGAFFLGVF